MNLRDVAFWAAIFGALALLIVYNYTEVKMILLKT
tara:strand:- start:295 stop:399 length:105 start_codon:yes stop_codon:yes gene_type:complete